MCLNRRNFLKNLARTAAAATAAGTCGFPTIVSAAALGRDGAVAPSNRIAMGFVGLGWMGLANLEAFLPKDEVQVVALCDLDSRHLSTAQDKVRDKYGKQIDAPHDFRDLLNRKDLDAVVLSLPDHWHAVPAVMAARNGLDIYGEKPLSYNHEEGRAMCDAVSRYGRIWQTGSWQRSKSNFHQACELVRNGRIGKVEMVEVGLGDGHADFDKTKDQFVPTDPPEGFDYDMWLGPAPWSPFSRAKLHKSWRWVRDTGGGMLSDWICHHLDIAHWGLDLDETGPVLVEASGITPEGLWNTPTQFDVLCTYANGVKIRVCSALPGGCRWLGENDKWIHVDREKLVANPTTVLDEVIGAGESRLYKSTDHWQNFLDCVKSRRETITPCETAHRSTTVAHLGLIGIETGRKLRWDPKIERIQNDEDANRLLGRPMRAPWRLEA